MIWKVRWCHIRIKVSIPADFRFSSPPLVLSPPIYKCSRLQEEIHNGHERTELVDAYRGEDGVETDHQEDVSDRGCDDECGKEEGGSGVVLVRQHPEAHAEGEVVGCLVLQGEAESREYQEAEVD